MDDFTIHACEQVLRFSRANTWNDLSEERKVQLGFNMGVTAHGLNLTKEQGFDALANTRQGNVTMQELHEHILEIVEQMSVPISEENIKRSF
tara:strand:- start:2577 stop:2852 length:276 start_codon:yes stop_codon:yes gene_type:complete